MANAFQDQLLKAGLVDSNKVKKANREKHKQVKQQQHTNSSATDAAKLQAQQASAQKADGFNSNLNIIDEKTSTVYATVGVKF